MQIGFEPDEIALDRPTREARLKWVVVVDASLPSGRAVNAAICVAAAVGRTVSGVLGPDGTDPDGAVHPGLPWAGCSVLGADADRLDALRRRAAVAEGVHVADMPVAAQETRVYAEYLDAVRRGDGLPPLAVSLLGPRNRIDKLTKGLTLLV